MTGWRSKSERVVLLRKSSAFSILQWRVSKGLEGKNIDRLGPVFISGVNDQ